MGRLIVAKFLVVPMVLVAMSALGAAPPKISKVTLSAGAGGFNATLGGVHFGVSPVALPCNACAIPELAVVEPMNIRAGERVNILTWTDTSITLSGITGAAANALFITVKNDALANLATWGGNIPGKGSKPKIAAVAFSGAGANLQITLTGSGFGAAPAGVPGTTDVPYFNMLLWNIKAPAQFNFPWAAGWNGQSITDTVTLNYTSWSDTKIVINGFAGAYGSNGFVESKGDPYVITLWQTPGVVAGQTGPQTAKGGRLP